jgi:hypothetical protein
MNNNQDKPPTPKATPKPKPAKDSDKVKKEKQMKAIKSSFDLFMNDNLHRFMNENPGMKRNKAIVTLNKEWENSSFDVREV